jgi:hypothetical protein
MATRSRFFIKHPDTGVYFSQYCHWDGYPDHNGRILTEHYTTPISLTALIELGNLSILAPIPYMEVGHTFDSPVKGYCVAYGRDRGEEDSESQPWEHLRTLEDIETHIKARGSFYGDIEFFYIHDGEQWHCWEMGGYGEYDTRVVTLTGIVLSQ